MSCANAQSITERFLKEGRITVGIHNQPPYGYIDTDGELAGFGPEMVKAVLGPLGVKKVDFVIMDWGALIPSLVSRRIDAIATGMVITRERCKQVIFSNPNAMFGDAVLVRAGNPKNIHSFSDFAKNPSLRLGGVRNTSNVEDAIKAGIPTDRVLLFQTSQASIAALLAGRTDGDTQSVGTATRLVRDPNLKGKLELATPFVGLMENGKEVGLYDAIVFRPEDIRLRDVYNESLKKRKTEGAVKEVLIKNGFQASNVAPDDVTPKGLYDTCR